MVVCNHLTLRLKGNLLMDEQYKICKWWHQKHKMGDTFFVYNWSYQVKIDCYYNKMFCVNLMVTTKQNCLVYIKDKAKGIKAYTTKKKNIMW